jgi:osmotically-inducible protein OsmY
MNLQRGVTNMKKRNIIINCLLIFALVVALGACASTPKQSSTGELIDDSVITTKIKALLAADNLLKSFQIGVETNKGTVQLSGFVSSQEAVDKAEQISKSVQGVKSLKNDLIVK